MNAGTTLRDRLLRDKSSMEDCMTRVGNGQSDIWQNNLIYAVCLALWDILEYILKNSDSGRKNP